MKKVTLKTRNRCVTVTENIRRTSQNFTFTGFTHISLSNGLSEVGISVVDYNAEAATSAPVAEWIQECCTGNTSHCDDRVLTLTWICPACWTSPENDTAVPKRAKSCQLLLIQQTEQQLLLKLATSNNRDSSRWQTSSKRYQRNNSTICLQATSKAQQAILPATYTTTVRTFKKRRNKPHPVYLTFNATKSVINDNNSSKRSSCDKRV